MDIAEVFQRLGLALGLGLLVGSQRQRASSALAGIRTFPIITVFGALCALLAHQFGGWVIAAGIISVAATLFAGNLHKMSASGSERNDAGITTEVAALLMFGIGTYAMVGHLPVALTLGAGLAVLLHFKRPLHSFIRTIGNRDIHAIMQFVLIALVILPVLPNRAFGPYDIINPFQTWLVVVLIVGISLLAYLTYRIFGAKLGTVLGGILGGLISSTATTFSYAQKAKSQPNAAKFAATVITIASAVAFARIIAEICVVAPNVSLAVAAPVTITFGTMALGAIILLLAANKQSGKEPIDLKGHSNPAELKSAVTFGVLYTAISFAVAMAKDHLGNKGLYVVGAISGLTDVDALTISTSQMARAGSLDTHIASQIILIGALSNLVFKGAAVAMIGRLQLAKYVLPVFASAILVGGITVLALPDAEKNPKAPGGAKQAYADARGEVR